MLEITEQRIREGINRLLSAPTDLKRWDAHIGNPSKDNALQEHRKLFENYKNELRSAVVKVEEEWEKDIEWNTKLSENRKQAVQEQWMTYPAGPAVHPSFVALIRRYWLACDALNRTVPKNQAVAPEALLIGWLDKEGAKEEESVKVLSCMPYWPVGLDQEENWI